MGSKLGLGLRTETLVLRTFAREPRSLARGSWLSALLSSLALLLIGCSGGSGPVGTIQCDSDTDCPVGYYCSPDTGICEMGCADDEACETGVCDLAAHVCVGCLGDMDCDAGQYCGPDQTCEPGCASDSDCAGMEGMERCNLTTHTCVACTDDAQCPEMEFCSDGVCRGGCDEAHPCEGEGESCCDGMCVDTQVNRENCGGCAMACLDGQVCDMGTCGVPCPEGQLLCDGACVGPVNNPMHCGACGVACGAAEVCAMGVCTDVCPEEQENCSGACADVSSDDFHCGVCGNACDAGYRCNEGACELSCPAGQTACGDSCVDTQTDRFHCGGCYDSCLSGEICVGGLCELSCPSEPVMQTPCDGVCVDLMSDPDHCGMCGRICPQGCVGAECATIAAIEISEDHSCTRYNSGRAFCWGRAGSMLTRGAPTGWAHIRAPVEVTDSIGRPLEQVRQIATGEARACAVRSDGRIVCWGAGFGSFGTAVAGVTRAVTIDGRDGEFCAATLDGDVYCFTALDDASVVMGVTRATAVAVGRGFSCALNDGGTVSCWGDNSYGMLGDGTTTDSATPVTVSGITNAIGVDAGAYHACARLRDGEVRCWGLNSSGQLGDGTTMNRSMPTPVAGARGALGVRTGASYSCAVMADRTVKCWGENGLGQLGNGNTTDQTMPTTVPGLSMQRQVAVYSQHTCALGMDNQVRCWGDNAWGEAGGDTEGSALPAPVTGVSGATALTRSGYSYCAITAGRVMCWGTERASPYSGNSFGELGRGSTLTMPITTPDYVTGLNNVTQLHSGSYFHCALRSDRRVLCWGRNLYGEVGDGTLMERREPVLVPGITDAVELSGGSAHACVRRAGGTVRCWGYNFYGQLGNGTERNSALPVTVTGLTNVTRLQSGWHYNCALQSSGDVRCWGYNIDSNLGIGSTTNQATPVRVETVDSSMAARVYLTGISRLQCQGTRCMAWPSGGAAPYTWGAEFGRVDRRAVQAAHVADWDLINVTGRGSGATYCWINTAGETRCVGRSEWGDGRGGFSYNYGRAPVLGGDGGLITGSFSGVVTGGYNRHCALGTDGRVYCWGRSSDGHMKAAGIDQITRTPALIGGPGEGL